MSGNVPLNIGSEALQRYDKQPRKVTPEYISAELARCKTMPEYFIRRYAKIYDNDTRSWIPFELWDAQVPLVHAFAYEKRVVVLKARQLGITWLALAVILWDSLFNAIAETLCFSQGDKDAMALVGDQRLKGMIGQLPEWMTPELAIRGNNEHEIRLLNGSGVQALPENRGGDSHTVTRVFIDEADLTDDLATLITRAEPTLGSRGQFIIIGRANKDKSNSYFKQLYKTGRTANDKGWKSYFLPWSAHPGRT